MTAIPPVSSTLVPAAAAAPRSVAPAEPAAPPLLPPNPTLRFDGALSVLVLEFRDSRGEVVRSLPTEKELQAYRLASLRGQTQADSPGSTAEAAGNKEASGEGG